MKSDKELVDLAFEAMEQAYVPYSHFPVGAALLCADGTVYTGCNVENAAYGAGICAERSALVKAVGEGKKSFLRLAVAAESADYCTPCGICRQMLYEFGPELEVLCARKDRAFFRTTLQDLLPHGFGPSSLSKE
jgi:cytidine deaminase